MTSSALNGAGAGEVVRYERKGEAAVVTLNRPGCLNAVNDALVAALCHNLARAAEDGVGAVVLCGEGRAFCSGHDLSQPAEQHADGATLLRLERLADVTRRIRQLPVPVVAAVKGYALGAGCEFALSCDLVVAEPDAIFGFPEVEVGLAVTGGFSRLLPMAVGAAKARELVLLGRRISADEALRLGLVNVVAADALAEASAWASELAAKPRLALALAKSCLDRGPEGDLETAFGLETAASLALMNTPEAAEAAAAFLARRGQPDRRP